MMAAAAISGIYNLVPPSLTNYRDRDLRTCCGRDHDVVHARMVKCLDFTPAHFDMDRSERNCGCGMASASSQSVSTSGQGRHGRTDKLLIFSRKLQRKLSMKKVNRKSASPIIRSCASLEKDAKQGEREKCAMDMVVDVAEEEVVMSRKQRRRAALAALAVAGYVAILQPCPASAVTDVTGPVTTIEEAQHVKGSARNELEGETQILRTAPPLTESKKSLTIAAASTSPIAAARRSVRVIKHDVSEDVFYAWRQVQKEIDMEADPFYAWKRATQEIRMEGGMTIQEIENDSFYAWKRVLKETGVYPPPPAPKSPVKKAVAASVAVAVAGSVAGAASAAGRVVASSGGTNVVASSLTILQHSSFPGATLLAKLAQHLGGGGVAGALGATVVFPLDTIKTRMQAENLEGQVPQYKDEIDCFKQLMAKEGPASLYSGLVPQLLGTAPEKAMKLTVNEALLSSLETLMPGARVWALEFIAGGGGGASQVVFTNPMEIVKVRLQTQKDASTKKEFWTIVKELGVKGLYDGAGVTLARDVPSSAIFFAVYTLLRGLYPDQSFLAGSIAAIPATVLVTPMDIIKTRLQKEPAPGEEPYTDWWQCMQDIVRIEGPQALFKGSLLRVLRTSPQFGITLMIYGLLTEGS